MPDEDDTNEVTDHFDTEVYVPGRPRRGRVPIRPHLLLVGGDLIHEFGYGEPDGPALCGATPPDEGWSVGLKAYLDCPECGALLMKQKRAVPTPLGDALQADEHMWKVLRAEQQ